MSFLPSFEFAQARLRQLETELGNQQQLARQLEQTIDYGEMARVRLAGGVVFLNAPTLQRIQELGQETQMLRRAIEQQRQRAAELEGQFQLERQAARRRRREQVALRVWQALDDLCSSLDELRQLCDDQGESPLAARPAAGFQPRKAG